MVSIAAAPRQSSATLLPALYVGRRDFGELDLVGHVISTALPPIGVRLLWGY